MKTRTVIENFINGNLTDAKHKAELLKMQTIYNCLRRDFGKGHLAAYAITRYLKGKGSFQAACDADAKPI